MEFNEKSVLCEDTITLLNLTEFKIIHEERITVLFFVNKIA